MARTRVLVSALSALTVLCAIPCHAQTPLTLQEAVDRALQSRASLKAESERIAGAEGAMRQARAFPNPEVVFQNENLRPGQDYTNDVDTLAYFVQPLDVLGKRGRRTAVAQQGIVRARAEYEQARWQVVRDVRMAYWAARGAQASRDLLRDTVATFAQIVQYHEAQLSVGTIAEQDVLRVRLEGERLQVTANLAAVRASRAEGDLLRAIGQADLSALTLTEPLDRDAVPPAATEQLIGQRPDIKTADAAAAEARARAALQDALGRPDLSVTYGYKRSQLPGTAFGSNTSIAGVSVRVPLFDRNSGNRATAAAETRRQEQLLAAARISAQADVRAAAQEYALRRTEVAATLTPLRDHAASLASISQAAYTQGGGDLLRLLDAQRARLEAELAWVQGMVEYQQSIVNLEAAEGFIQ